MNTKNPCNEVLLTTLSPCNLGGPELLFMRQRYEENTRSISMVTIRPTNSTPNFSGDTALEPYSSRPFFRKTRHRD